MNVLMLIMLFHHTPVAEFSEKVAQQKPEGGYETLHYNLDHHQYSIPVRVHVTTGCIVRFSRPFDDAWASDNKGNATGEFFKFARWGSISGKPMENQLIISSVLFSEKRQNLFVMIEGHVVELVLTQTRTYKDAHRLIKVELTGGKREPFLPKRTVKTKNEPVAVPMGQKGNRHTKAPNGHMLYNISGQQHFVLFSSNAGIPDVEKIEIIRGKSRKLGKGFHYEMPIQAKVQKVGDSYLLTFPSFQLEKGERLYLRVKHKGERTAKVKKLKKRWWRR